MKIRLKPRNTALRATWNAEPRPPGLGLQGAFVSPYKPPLAPVPGVGLPDPSDPASLPRLYPVPSTQVVTSVLGARVAVGGEDVAQWVVSLDLVRPLHGETQGRIELLARDVDPDRPGSPFRAGAPCEIDLELPGVPVTLLRGFVVEPPKFRLLQGGLGSLTLAVGCLLLLKRQSETGRIEPYCGEPPSTVAQAAQVFANARGIPGVWGGSARVQGVSPDFVEGAPWEFLASLYEPLNWDVRTATDGVPGAVPRGTFNPGTAIRLTSDQCLEGNLDSPSSKPFSVVRGYSEYTDNQGFVQRETENTDYTSWNSGDTDAWFIRNNTYTVTKNLVLGDSVLQSRVETWGYLPTTDVVPTGTRPGPSEGPCGEFIPAPELPVVGTELRVIQVRVTRLFVEPHLSGNFLVTRRVTTVEGWGTYPLENGDTKLYFGTLESGVTEYRSTPIPTDGVCPQYWPVLNTATQEYAYSRVAVTEFAEPEYRLVSRASEAWERTQSTSPSGTTTHWVQTGSAEAYDTDQALWVGGAKAQGTGSSPPSAQFVGPLRVETSLETELRFPELQALFGERVSKPVRFSAYSQADLETATDRFGRESAGLAYSLHLILDPRVPLRPGASVRYVRPDGTEVHGLVWTQEFNVTGTECTQSVVLLRTFTEPALLSLRNGGTPPESITSTSDPCL